MLCSGICLAKNEDADARIDGQAFSDDGRATGSVREAVVWIYCCQFCLCQLVCSIPSAEAQCNASDHSGSQVAEARRDAPVGTLITLGRAIFVERHACAAGMTSGASLSIARM